jgi:cellulose synthase/poly-beta-1,6-N-acetylglucosamine synthase-like glycosyltransferase
MLLDLHAVMSVLYEWEHQRFMGVRVGPGDDRNMTSRFLQAGYGVAYNCDSISWTDCPEDWVRWIRQQLRWARSATREFLSSLFWIWGLPLWSVWDNMYLIVFPFLLLGVILGIVYQAASLALTSGIGAGVDKIAPYIGIVIFFNFLRALYGVLCNNDLRFFTTFLYIFLHVRYLMWVKVYALLTPTDSTWLGRKGK